MKPFWTATKALRRAVAWRQRVRGPLRASWDETYETLALFLHHYSKRSQWLPLNVQRRLMTGVIRPSGKAASVRLERTTAAGVPATWFRHEQAIEGRVLYYLHGGGYVLGSVNSHRHLIARLCRAARATGFAIDYRLAPEHPYPAQLQDAVSAYRWLLAQGVSPENLIIAGESAGGGLTLSTMMQLRHESETLPAGAVLISPWLDLEGTGQSHIDNEPYDFLNRRLLKQFATRFVEPHQLREPLAAPLYADLTGLPPLLIHAGGAEILLDDAVRVAERARQAGVSTQLEVYPDMIHAWHIFAPLIPQALTAIADIGTFIDSTLSAAAEQP